MYLFEKPLGKEGDTLKVLLKIVVRTMKKQYGESLKIVIRPSNSTYGYLSEEQKH